MQVHLVVATPGRIVDLCGRKVADLSQCKTMVMDEADKLLSPEFQPVIEELISYLHPEKQIMLFSATFPILVKAFKVMLKTYSRKNSLGNHMKST